MFWKKKDKRTTIQREIDDLLLEMESMDVQSDAYKERLATVEKLTKVKESYQPERRVSLDAVLGFVANILGIFMILHHEELNVISSKALSFVKKPDIKSIKK